MASMQQNVQALHVTFQTSETIEADVCTIALRGLTGVAHLPPCYVGYTRVPSGLEECLFVTRVWVRHLPVWGLVLTFQLQCACDTTEFGTKYKRQHCCN